MVIIIALGHECSSYIFYFLAEHIMDWTKPGHTIPRFTLLIRNWISCWIHQQWALLFLALCVCSHMPPHKVQFNTMSLT